MRTEARLPDGNPADPLVARALTIARRLLAYCQSHDWAGADPYDALNSRLFRALPFLNFKLARLALTQTVKRSPIDLRPLLLVPRTHNSKGLALFLGALMKLERLGCLGEEGRGWPAWMAGRLLELRSPDTPSWCWGYNFSWQTRFLLVPQGSPNIICTTFVANALLDWHERTGDPQFLAAAVSAAGFILDVLYWKTEDGLGCFSYTPLWRSEVHNASLLGAALLCRVAAAAGESRFREPALQAARRAVRKQHPDGAWDYGESDQPSQRWKDNFHTGYNLCALGAIGRHAATAEFEPSVRLGFDYYRRHFFCEDGAPKYYHDRTYPIDIHSVAQSVLTLLAFRDLAADNVALARRVLEWGLNHMWDERGYFYCQKNPRYTIRIPYMRWAQAWMLWTLATFLDETATDGAKSSAA